VRVHLPSGLVVRVRASEAAGTTLADFCPRRQEHTAPGDKRRYEATIHPTCGLAVVYVRKAKARARSRHG